MNALRRLARVSRTSPAGIAGLVAVAAMIAIVATVATAGATGAQTAVQVEQAACFRMGDNQVVKGSTLGETAGSTVRLYFRWDERGAFYWVDMEHDGPGVYWGIPPKPEKRNVKVEYYGTVMDASGKEIARSQMHHVEVKPDCRVVLTPRQRGVAQNLTIGETAAAQAKGEVLGFLCDGIVTRVGANNVKRADDVCRVCLVAWWQRGQVILPALAAGGITTVVIDQPEPSPSRP